VQHLYFTRNHAAQCISYQQPSRVRSSGQLFLHAPRTKSEFRCRCLLFRRPTNLERCTSRHQQSVINTVFQKSPSQHPIFSLITPSVHLATARTSCLSFLSIRFITLQITASYSVDGARELRQSAMRSIIMLRVDGLSDVSRFCLVAGARVCLMTMPLCYCCCCDQHSAHDSIHDIIVASLRPYAARFPSTSRQPVRPLCRRRRLGHGTAVSGVQSLSDGR